MSAMAMRVALVKALRSAPVVGASGEAFPVGAQ